MPTTQHDESQTTPCVITSQMTTVPPASDPSNSPVTFPHLDDHPSCDTDSPSMQPQQADPNHHNAKRLKHFIPPTNYVLSEVPKSTPSRSIIYSAGVLVSGVQEVQGQEKWFCLIENCSSVISVRKNKSNITDHLGRKHSIESQRTRNLLKTRSAVASKMTKERQVYFQMSQKRYHQVNVVKLVLRKMLPFDVVQCPEFRTLITMLDQRNEFTPLTPETVKKIILEMYLATVSKFTKISGRAKKISPVPLFHLNVDLWTSPTSRSKYFGLRLSFVDSSWEPRSFLLAVRLFRPSTALMDGKKKVLLSDVLLLWTKRILAEFGLTVHDLFSSVSDSGSDIKRLCSVLLPSKWDWCVSHLMNCALVESFGTSINHRGCQNMEFKEFYRQVKKVIEHLNKSSNMKRRFEDLQDELCGTKYKLIQDQPHRWLGTVRVMERVLLLWNALREHYYRNEQRSFPLDQKRKRLLELFSLMKPCTEIIVSAQSTMVSSSIETFLAICNLEQSLLSPSSMLPLRDPAVAGYEKGIPIRCEMTTVLDSLTIRTRDLLRKAVQKRFYNGYHGTERSSSFELQVFFYPSYRNLTCLDSVMGTKRATECRETIKNEVKDLCATIARSRETETSIFNTSTSGSSAQPNKLQKLTGTGSKRGIWNFTSFEAVDNDDKTTERTIDEEIEDEIRSYMSSSSIKPSDLQGDRLLRWWKTNSLRYPTLSVVARIVLGHPASSAAIERDFGISGMVLNSRRSRLDSAFVDMQLLLKSNLSNIPSLIPELKMPNSDYMDFIPNRFTGLEPIEKEALGVEVEISSDSECEQEQHICWLKLSTTDKGLV